MNYEEMRVMEKTHVCAECLAPLVTAWDSENNCHRLCCGPNHGHNGFERILSPQQALQRGKADEVIQPGAQKDLEERAKRSETALRLLPKEDLGDGRALGIAEIGQLVLWSESVDLNAHLGHVCLFHGKPYVTIDGYYYLNNRQKQPYRVETRPMTLEEKTAYMIEEAAYAYIARAWLRDKLLPDTGIGYVPKDEVDEKSKRHPDQWRSPIVHGHPQRIAEKRAEWQLLRKLIPLEVKE